MPRARGGIQGLRSARTPPQALARARGYRAAEAREPGGYRAASARERARSAGVPAAALARELG